MVKEASFERFCRITADPLEQSCVFAIERRYLRALPHNTSMIITTTDVAGEIKNYDGGICICDKPKVLFFRLLNYYNHQINKQEMKSTIGINCSISGNANISQNNVHIGRNVTIEDFAVVYSNTIIEDNVIIRAGAKIGIQDYNYYIDQEKITHIEHAGGVYLGKDVEIGYNTVIGKGLYAGDITEIKDNTKVAHNCSIGHDVRMGQHCMVYSGAVIGGNTMIGDRTHITMNSTIKNGLKIGSDAIICMGANVLVDVRENTSVFGNPATKVKL